MILGSSNSELTKSSNPQCISDCSCLFAFLYPLLVKSAAVKWFLGQQRLGDPKKWQSTTSPQCGCAKQDRKGAEEEPLKTLTRCGFLSPEGFQTGMKLQEKCQRWQELMSWNSWPGSRDFLQGKAAWEQGKQKTWCVSPRKKDFLELGMEPDPRLGKEQDLSKGLFCSQALRGCHPWELGDPPGMTPNPGICICSDKWERSR